MEFAIVNLLYKSNCLESNSNQHDHFLFTKMDSMVV